MVSDSPPPGPETGAPPPAAGSAPPPPQPQFKIHTATAVLFGLALLTSSVSDIFPIGDATPAEIGEKLGAATSKNLIPLGVAVLFGWLAFLIAKRSSRVGNIVAGIFLSLHLIGGLALIAINLLKPTPGTTDTSGDEAVDTVKQVSAAKAAELKDKVEASNAAVLAFTRTGGFRMASVDSKQVLADRRELVAAAINQTAGLEEFLSNYVDDTKERLLEAGLSEEQASHAIKGTRLVFPEEELVGRTQATIDSMVHADKALAILEDQWGKWEHNPDTGMSFHDDFPTAAREDLVAATEGFDEAAIRHEQFSAKLAERGFE